MLPEDRVGIVQYKALCALVEHGMIGMIQRDWWRAINAITLYGQAPAVSESLLRRKMVKRVCVRAEHVSHDLCRIVIQYPGLEARLRLGMVQRLVATR